MNKKVYDISYQLNMVFSKREYETLFTFCSVSEFFFNLSQNLQNKKIEVIISESEYRYFSSKVFEPLKERGITLNYLLVESENLTNDSQSLGVDGEADVIIAVGNDSVLSKVKQALQNESKTCYLIPTTPYIENLFYNTNDKNFFSVIDVEVLQRAKNESYSESYMAVMNKLTALIDYKINSFVSGSKMDGLLFDRVKSAINTVAVLPTYSNYKKAIIGAELTLAIVNKNGDLVGYGADCVLKALSYVAPNLTNSFKQALAFEKTVKLYHMFFSNDLSSLLSVADYNLDIELLSSLSGLDKSTYYKNLKIPSEKRRVLINILINKISKEILKETTAIMSVSKKVITIYNNINNKEKETASLKQIKTAVNLASYLSGKTSVLTLLRDGGVLKCAN